MRSGPAARYLPAAAVTLIGALLVEVLSEGWVQALATTGTATPPGWPKLVKNALVLLLAAVTLVTVALRRRWRDFTTPADLALAVLVVVLVLAGIVGGSPPKLIGQALYVYLRGAVVFYAIRAADLPFSWLRRLLYVAGGIVALDVAVALVQMVVGVPAYTALGWDDLTWAKTSRAQGLLNHPNHLGHLLGLALLGLLAWMLTRPRVRYPWWLAFGAGALALSAAQSRESVVAFCICALVLWLLLRGGRRVVAAVLVVLVCTGAQVLLRPANLAEWNRRLGGVVNAIHPPAPSPARTPTPGQRTGPGTTTAVRPKPVPKEIRVLYYKQGLKLLAHQPVLGYGVGQFGGIVAQENNPDWNENPRFGPGGFDRYGFASKQVDSFWLHLVVETGLLGLAAYIAWLFLLVRPLWTEAARRDRAGPGGVLRPWAVAAMAFAVQVAFLSASLEDELFPTLLFTLLGMAWTTLRIPAAQPVEPEPVPV
jgi:hypothetical protein